MLEYTWKCPHCNHWMTLIHDFPKNVIELSKDALGRPNHNLHLSTNAVREQDTHAYICMKCHRYVSDETRIKGIWRPLYPHRTQVRGYQISQLMCPWISPSELMKKKNDYGLDQLFENYVIGRPYLGDNIMINRGDILRCIDRSMTSPYDLRRENVVQGVDWGNRSWGVNAMAHPDNPEKIIILDIWDVTEEEAIETGGRRDNPHIRKVGEKMRTWDARRGVFDAGYGKDRNWELVQDFPGKIFSCFYPSLSTANNRNMEDNWVEADHKVSVDRTQTLLIMAKLFRDGKIVIPEWVAQNPLFETYVQHLTNLVMVRDIDIDEKTKKETITTRIGMLPGGDHFGHATNYMLIALRKAENSGSSEFFY